MPDTLLVDTLFAHHLHDLRRQKSQTAANTIGTGIPVLSTY
jgi:hypothetical protein